jgi:hypothetical protein
MPAAAPIGPSERSFLESRELRSKHPRPGGLAVKELDIEDGRITVGRTDSTKTHVYDSVSIAVRNFAFEAQFPFTLSADLPSVEAA